MHFKGVNNQLPGRIFTLSSFLLMHPEQADTLNLHHVTGRQRK